MGLLALMALAGADRAVAQAPPEPLQQWPQSPGAIRPAEPRAPGDWFPFSDAFVARITNAQIMPYLLAGGCEIAAGLNQQLLVLTIELRNERADRPVRPPVQQIKWLSTYDATRTVRPDPATTRLNLDAGMGGRANAEVAPNETTTLTAVYKIPSDLGIHDLYYTVSVDTATGQIDLATLP